MRIFNNVMFRFGSTRIPRDSTLLAEAIKLRRAPSQDLVNITLMSGIKEQYIVRRLKDPMHGDRQLDNPEVGAKMATSSGDFLNEKFADLLGKFYQLSLAPTLEVGR